MAFDVVASSFVLRAKERSPLWHTVIAGLSFGGVSVFSALVGILAMFHGRWIIENDVNAGAGVAHRFLRSVGWLSSLPARPPYAKAFFALALQGAGGGSHHRRT